MCGGVAVRCAGAPNPDAAPFAFGKTMADQDLEDFRGYLRGLLMHGAVATAIGGVSTLVGEPENIVIGAHNA